MSKTILLAALLLAVLASPGGLAAQDEESSASFAYGTYFQCDPTEEWLADAIVDQLYAPVYDGAVEDGTISAWGWLKHHTGGQWRRVVYHVAPTMDGLFDAAETIGAKIDEANAAASAKLGEICPSHDDYIWQTVTGSGGAGSAQVAMVDAKAGVSVYMVCDMARQERADELVMEFASVYDGQVEAGNMAAWGWMSHVVGGKYRRLLNLRGSDHKTVMAAWGNVIEELGQNHGAAMDEFSEICGSHQDYLWDIR